MNSLLEHCLSKEDKGIQRLVWILQMKQMFPLNPEFKEQFNLLRDEQVIILKGKGHKYGELCDKARKYECIWKMFD